MADKRNRTPFYGAVPTSKLNADHVFMADGSTLQEQADKKFELIEEITLTEDTTIIERSTTPDNKAYDFKKIILSYTRDTTAASTDTFYINDYIAPFGISSRSTALASGFIYTCIMDCSNGVFYGLTPATYSRPINMSIDVLNNSGNGDLVDSITHFKIVATQDTFKTNMKIKIYGLWK